MTLLVECNFAFLYLAIVLTLNPSRDQSHSLLLGMFAYEKSVGGIPTKKPFRCNPRGPRFSSFLTRAPLYPFSLCSELSSSFVRPRKAQCKRQFPKTETRNQKSMSPVGHRAPACHHLSVHDRLLRICEYILFNPFPWIWD